MSIAREGQYGKGKVERTEVHHASHHHDEKKEEEKEEESHHADLALRESSAKNKKEEAELGEAKKDDSVRSVHFLDPSDALFQSLGAAFTKQLVEDFGTDHLYLADTFREIRDPNDDFSESHVARVGAATKSASPTSDSLSHRSFEKATNSSSGIAPG